MAGGSSTRFLSEAHGRVGRWLRNKWHLDSLIAIGGMAAVYASTHRNGARAAIKLLHSQYTRNEQARRRFLAEGYAANKVGHRNAVLVLDDDTTEDGEVYLVMELLEGESLEGRLERLGVMGPMEVLAIADQLLEVLACAHPKGILHRDIKPANIYLTRDGSVKLLDFGLARVRELSAEALDQSDGIVFGTVSYIAPEQARADNQNLDSRSDMWSIAATMFRALSGETVHPSTGPIIERLLAVARKPARSIASLVPHLPRPVIELVDRALAFDPEDRWPSANVMRVVVQDVMAQLQEAAESDEMEVEIQQPAPSRRNNTLPVTTRAKTLDLPTVRAGGGTGATDPNVPRPKTDPVGLSTRPRNLPPSEPAPPDGDETELDLDGLYDKARANAAAAPRNPGRSRTLLTKEGRAELRRILDARKAGTPTPEPEPAPEPQRSRPIAGPDTSGVGDIEVEFEDSIIEVTIGHTRGSRSGPIAERISEPSSVTPAPVASEPRPAEPRAGSLATNDIAAAAPSPAASETAIAIDEDEDDAEEEEAEAAASPVASKPASNLRPPSTPSKQAVPSDSRSALSSRSPSPTPQPSGDAARSTGRSAQGEITRVGPPPRPATASSESPRPPASSEARPPASSEPRPAAPTLGAREITKVGPAPVAPTTPPVRESPAPAARANAGSLHETMRGAATPVVPPARSTKDEVRPGTGAPAGLLNETIRPGAAPPPAHARSGPIPVGRGESEPARSTTFAAPVRPGAEASTPARATSFMPPAGRVTPTTPAATASTPATPAAAAAAPGPATLRFPNAAARPASTTGSPVGQPTPGKTASNDTAASKAGPSDAAASNKPVTNPAVSKTTANDAAATSPIVANPTASNPIIATKPATNPTASNPTVPTRPATNPTASNPIIATKPATNPTASNPTVAEKPATNAGVAKPVAGPGAASKPATTGVVVPAAGSIATNPVTPGASPVAVPTVPSSSPSSVPVVPTVSVPVVPARAPIAAPTAAPVATKSTPAAEVKPEPPVEAAPAPEPVRAGKSMFNPYPSLAGGGSTTAKTASYATIPAAVPKDSSVVSPNPRTNPNAKTAPHAAVGAAVPKDSTPGPQDSSQSSRTSGPAAKTAAYATVSAEEPKSSETRGKTGAAPVLPFSFLRGTAKPGEPAEPTPPDDPNRPGRKKP